MFSTLLESAKVRLFQATDTYSNFEGIKVIYETFILYKEENLYMMKRISANSFSAGECK
jgi:hypothetical protein